MVPGASTFVLGIQATREEGGLPLFSNYDSDGPSFSQYNENQLYNYELSAPGVNIIVYFSKGKYAPTTICSLA